MSRRIVLPEWITVLKDRMNFLEDELKKYKKLQAEVSRIDNDVKCLKKLFEEKMKFEVAQGSAMNVPIIAQNNVLAGAKRNVKAGEHSRKSIHTPTFSSESKIIKNRKNSS